MSYRLKIICCCLFLSIFGGLYVSYAQKRNAIKATPGISKMVDSCLSQSVEQYKFLMNSLPKDKLPRTFQDGKLMTVTEYAWISGFYPGSLFYLYQYSGDTILSHEAIERLKLLEKL